MNIIVYDKFKTSCECKINQEQIAFINLVKHLNKKGANIDHIEMSDNIENKFRKLNSLPVTVINNEIVKEGSYPLYDDFKTWLNNKDIEDEVKINKKSKINVYFIVLTVIIISLGTIGMIGGLKSIRIVFHFISRQIMGMRWLDSLVSSIFTKIFGESFMATRWGNAIQFFVYDTIKIIVLLCILIFSISYIQSYFPPERTKKILGKYKGIGANAIGGLLGILTPFCSCSSIPIFIGFTSAGISSGVTFSFLIASPLIDLGALILLASTFGFPIAITYVLVGLSLAIVGGVIIEKTGVGKHVMNFGDIAQDNDDNYIELTKKERLIIANNGMLTTLRKVWIYIIVGVGIGATIHNFIPETWIQTVLGADKWYSVLVATFAGTPMYADIFGTIPVAQALFTKGVGVGTIITFMMSVTVLSLPSMIMLSKAVKPKLFATFITIVVIGVILIGYIFNGLNFLYT